MNKEGIEFEWSTLMYFFVGFVAFFLIVHFFILSPQGIYGTTKLAEKLGLSKLPEKPEEKLKEIPEERIPEELKNSYNDLIKNLKFWKDKEERNCLIKFKAFPDNFENHIINIHLVEDTKDYGLTIINKLGQSLLPNVIKDIIPCYARSSLSIYDVININIKNKDTLKSVEILEKDFNLLYKKSNQYICFLENCDNDCLQSLMFKNKIPFCDKSYEDDFKDVLFEGTYYGNLEDWKPGGNRWYYKLGDSMESSNVAYTFHVKGLSNSEFKKVFDITKGITSEKKKNSILYKGKYYGLKKDWCYEKIIVKKLWGLWTDEKEKWICYKECDGVDVNEISMDLKNELFGPPDYSPKCEEVETLTEVKDVTEKKIDVDLIGIHQDIQKKLNLKFTEEFEKEVMEWEAKALDKDPKSKTRNPETGEFEHMSFEKYASLYNFEEERADAKSAAEYILKDPNKGEKVESLLNELKPFYYGKGYVSKAEKSEINLYNLKEAYEIILKYLNPTGEEIAFSYNKEESYMGQLAKEMVNTYRPGICQDKASTVITFLKIAGYDVIAYPYPFAIGEYGAHVRVLVKIDNVWIALDPTIYPEEGFVPLFP